jgi:hypothetical protein
VRRYSATRSVLTRRKAFIKQQEDESADERGRSRLYREIRSLRIYEGASEVQKIIIGGEWVKAAATNRN